MELMSNKTKRRTATCVATLTAAGVSLGVVSLTGGSIAGAASGTTGAAGTTGDTAARTVPGPGHGPGGGPLGQLTEDQVQCLQDEGVDVPDKPEAGETPQPPDSSDRPTPEEMKAAAEACDIDLPEPPAGADMRGGPPPQGHGAPCESKDGDNQKNESGSQKKSGSKNE